MLVRPFVFGAAHARTDGAALRVAVWCQRHPFWASLTVCVALLIWSPVLDLLGKLVPLELAPRIGMWTTGALSPTVLGLGLVALPTLFHVVGRQQRWIERMAPPMVVLVASMVFAAANWAVSGGTAEDDLNVASMFVGCPAVCCWATGFALRWRVVRALGRPWVLVAGAAAFGLWGFFISTAVGLTSLFVLLVLLPLAVHGALASEGRFAWIVWPMVATGAAAAAKIVEGTYFPDPLPATVGTVAALTLFAPLLSLGRVAHRLCAVPLDHPVVTDFGAALPYGRREGA